MKTFLYIVGTGHHYQFGAGIEFGGAHCSDVDHSAFMQMLRDLVIRYAANAIAEELNEQALREVGSHASVPQLLARQLRMPHLFCDPDRHERQTLQIYEDNVIRLSAFPETWDEVTVRSLIEQSWNRREEEWLRRLTTLGASRIIFVCGSNHVSTFTALADKCGFHVEVVHEDWTT